jgi:superfamily II DNA or RNA helicase
MTKDERGDIGINVWLKHNGRGTLNYTMQFGKTFVGIKVGQRAIIRNANVKVIILTPSEVVHTIWFRYIALYISTTTNVRIVTKNSMMNMNDLECDILIIDEIHKFLTDNCFEALTRIKFKFILGLTGTPPTKGVELTRLNLICPVIDIISEQEAVDNGWITPFEEFNYVIQFPEKDKERYISLSEPISETLSLFKGLANDINKYFKAALFKSDYSVIDACYRGVEHPFMKGIRFPPSDIRVIVSSIKGWRMDLELTNEYNIQLNEYWNPLAVELRTKMFDKQIRLRNTLMITHPLKLEKVNEVVLKFPRPTIIFNESTDFADAVCNSINKLGIASIPICTVYHSNIEGRFIKDDRGDYIIYKSGAKAGEPKKFGKTFLLADTIDGMTTGRYTCLSTSKALEIGLSISNIENVINTGGTTNPNTYKQRAARGKTVDIYNPNKKTLIVNVVFDNFIRDTIDENGNVTSKLIKSRDLTKLIERQGEFSDAKWVTSIDEISI